MTRRSPANWICLFLLCSAPVAAETFIGRVVAVTDGDTITVLDAGMKQHRVRLAGIDAPETAQPFGHRSKRHLSDLVYDKVVSVEYRKRDRYGRIVGKVSVAAPDVCPAVQTDCPRTLDAGLAQITVGLVWHYKQYANEQTEEDQWRYAFAEEEARAKHAGLWADANPEPPWEWRKTRR